MSPSVTILLVLISIIKAQTSIECPDEAGCQSQTIEKPQISCSGYKSCLVSTLTSTKATGFIDCTGSSSCGDTYDTPATISATKDVFCGGLRGCQRASISAKALSCTGYFSCYNVYPSIATEITTNIDCAADKGCWANYLKPGKKTNCDGATGCDDATIEGGIAAICNGWSSCWGATLSNQRRYVACGAGGGCTNTDITNTPQVRAYGHLSAMKAEINGVKQIKAFGAESLKKAIIDSDGLSTLTVRAYGELAGNEGTVICRSGSTCNLDCKGTGCSGLTYECETGATCNINPDGCLLDNSVVDVNGVTCPGVTTSAKAKKLLIKLGKGGNDKMMTEYAKMHVIDKDITKIATDADTTCSSESECDGDTISVDGNDIYCNGKSSCSSATITASNGADIACEGEESCISSVLDNDGGSIRCNGEGGCRMAPVATDKLWCYGFESCMDGDIEIAGDIVACPGGSSCHGASILGTSASIYCSGKTGCQEADITSSSVDCDGSYSCKEATITTSGNTKCIGYASCQKAISLDAASVVAKGSCSVMRANIYADTVSGLGYNSLYGAEIDSVGRNTVTVEAYGYNAGNTATFTCRANSECTLDCKGNGCDNLDYVCVNGATCNIDPVECENGRNKFQGVECPTITTAASDEEADEFIRQKRIKNEKLYAKLDEYVNYMMDNNDDDFDMELDEFLSQDDMQLFGNIDIMTMSGGIGQIYKWKIGGIIMLIIISMVYLFYKLKSKKEHDYQMLV